jgi:hypothetical protein
VIHVNEKRSYYHSNETEEEKVKETIALIPEERKDDWEEVKVSKMSNPNNKLWDMRGYVVMKDTRKRRRAKDGLLNLSDPESLKSIDNVRTEHTANLVQPLVSYYDSFPGVKNYETEEEESQTDITLTKRSHERMETRGVQGYVYEKPRRTLMLRQEKTEGFVYRSENKNVMVERKRSFDTEDYYFYKNEYYKERDREERKERGKQVYLQQERMQDYVYQKEEDKKARSFDSEDYYYYKNEYYRNLSSKEVVDKERKVILHQEKISEFVYQKEEEERSYTSEDYYYYKNEYYRNRERPREDKEVYLQEERTHEFVYSGGVREEKARSYDSDDYYFYKNEYYKKEEGKRSGDFEEKEEVPLNSYRMMNYNYNQVNKEESVDWEVEKKRMKQDCKEREREG